MHDSVRRLRRAIPSFEPSGDATRSILDRRWWWGAALGLAVGACTGGRFGVLLGLAVLLGCRFGMPRIESAAGRRSREVTAAEFPFALDLVAACLRSGAPVPQALHAAGAAVAAPLDQRFRRAATALSLGAPPAEAFTDHDFHTEAGPLRAAFDRSGRTGAKLADNLGLLAGELRDERHQAAVAAAHRAGVWMVLPLCLCFLPAFIAAGLVPIVVSAIGAVLTTL